MSEGKPVRCQKCGKLVGYVTITPKSVLAPKPTVENLKLAATCVEGGGGNGFYRRNF